MNRARVSLQLAGAVGIVQPGVEKEDHNQWWSDMRNQAGWS